MKVYNLAQLNQIVACLTSKPLHNFFSYAKNKKLKKKQNVTFAEAKPLIINTLTFSPPCVNKNNNLLLHLGFDYAPAQTFQRRFQFYSQ